MKILIVHELFPPQFAGGGEHLVFNMAKNLKKKGHQVKVLTSGNPADKEYEGIRTIRLPRNRYLMNFAVRRIMKAAKGADIIQTSTYNAAFPSWMAGKLLGKPVVCLVMSFWGDQWEHMRPGMPGKFSKFVEKVQLGRSFDKLIFLSDFSRDYAMQSGLPMNGATFINPGLDVSKYKPDYKDIEVLFSGRFAKQKGVYDVLKIAKMLPHINFTLMGWGEEEEEIRRLATENVTIVNYSNKDPEFYEHYGRAKIFLLPSYGETFGFVLVEAAAAGCAVVSTIPLGFLGGLHERGNVEAMAKNIDDLIQNHEECHKMGETNVQLAKKFTWDNFTDKLEKEYEKLLHSTK
ncbi:MAG: hypothetical protein CMH61_02905 [Nanoarchaeota archaeon]|nr:hypothetical protein [Nanoarchaeota archaeon]|tara:strand:- start:1243 stop:2283 length:1041 start_codon:yes stop_codon:yes gene_type:complete